MMIAVRELSTNMSSFELLSFRSLIDPNYVPRRRRSLKVKTRRIGMQVSATWSISVANGAG